MKKFIFFISILFIISCNKSDLPDSSESYIQISEFNPTPDSSITEATWINTLMQYNISQNETEGMGYYVISWSTFGSSDYWSGTGIVPFKLSKKSGQRLTSLDRIRWIPPHGEPDTITYKLTISRKEFDGSDRIIATSNTVTYIIEND